MIDLAQGSFDDPFFRQRDERAFDDYNGNSARFVGGPLRLAALITPVDEGHCHRRAPPG